MPTKSILEARLKQSNVPETSVRYMDESHVKSLVEQLHARFGPTLSPQRADILPTDSFDISAHSAEAVRGILSRYLAPGIEVGVLWMADNTGAYVNSSVLIANFDDFWYPSSDDVWITDDNLSLLVEFDHEEVLTIRRRNNTAH
jgi:hypothetical protein